MSGGAFDYKQNGIRDIIQQVEDIYENPALGGLDEISGELAFVITNALFALKAAYIYAQRLDWYISGDDDEYTMYERLGEELDELEKEFDLK